MQIVTKTIVSTNYRIQPNLLQCDCMKLYHCGIFLHVATTATTRASDVKPCTILCRQKAFADFPSLEIPLRKERRNLYWVYGIIHCILRLQLESIGSWSNQCRRFHRERDTYLQRKKWNVKHHVINISLQRRDLQGLFYLCRNI